MFEVERKFNYTEPQKELIQQRVQFLKTVTIHDIYYDFDDLRLLKKDYWLRSRNGNFELKKPKHTRTSLKGTDIYQEIEDEIKAELGISDFTRLIEIVNIFQTREKFKINEFNIDFDSVTSKMIMFSVENQITRYLYSEYSFE
jgi:adenylate cyclase class IV